MERHPEVKDVAWSDICEVKDVAWSDICEVKGVAWSDICEVTVGRVSVGAGASSV